MSIPSNPPAVTELPGSSPLDHGAFSMYFHYCYPAAVREVHMSRMIPGNQKHLTLDDRIFIENSLNDGLPFREIAKYLCKDPTTISKEIRLHRTQNTWNKGSFNNPYNFCVHRFRCRKKNVCRKVILCDQNCRSCRKCNQVCDRFERELCSRLEKAPYVCNGCGRQRNLCPISTKYFYDGRAAQRKYEELLKSSREGINMTPQELRQLDQIVRPLIISRGQSPYVILTNHPELDLSVRTLYHYIDQNVLLARNVDLKRKTKFKPRKCHKTQITNREVFQGRTYRDFQALNLKEDAFVEMDTVLSAKGSLKCIHTMYFPDTELFLAHLMNRCTPGAVKLVFEQYQKSLKSAEEFRRIFPLILTDRGKEFGDPDALVTSPDGTKRTAIYYCDPMRSSQKGGIEEAHTLLRMVLPKGTVFEDLTQWDIRRIVNHINSYPRKKLEGDTPYKYAAKKYGSDVLEAMQLRPVRPDEVNLTPQLLKK